MKKLTLIIILSLVPLYAHTDWYAKGEIVGTAAAQSIDLEERLPDEAFDSDILQLIAYIFSDVSYDSPEYKTRYTEFQEFLSGVRRGLTEYNPTVSHDAGKSIMYSTINELLIICTSAFINKPNPIEGVKVIIVYADIATAMSDQLQEAIPLLRKAKHQAEHTKTQSQELKTLNSQANMFVIMLLGVVVGVTLHNFIG